MQCDHCRSDNPADAKFCNACGHRLGSPCPACGAVNPPESNFCNQCCEALAAAGHETGPETVPTPHPLPGKDSAEGERKHVTAMFADISGYTAMAEKLDPEEVREILVRIFDRAARIVTRYDGFIEKFVGDAVLALFGVPCAHEDDPIRAVRVAREIKGIVERMNPELEDRIGQPLSVHAGINSGLVVTGAVVAKKGTHGLAGDTINLAARLCSLAPPGEIYISHTTYCQAAGHFSFERLPSTKVKGKTKTVPVYRYVEARELPSKTYRSSGFRSELVGRSAEMARLAEAVAKLKSGKGSVLFIRGDAGTGKSRLVEEFKSGLDTDRMQWLEGHAYPYSQNIPYFLLIDLFNRAFSIKEQDPADRVRDKIEAAVRSVVHNAEAVIPYVGSLYSLSYPQISHISPDYWRPEFQKAIQSIFAGLARRAPTIICLEDLHWADLSTLEQIRLLIAEFSYQVLFMCVSRPAFALFDGPQVNAMGDAYCEIQLRDLSPTETQIMLESLLKTSQIPIELKRFVQEKVEGNPFYLEEVVNTLIESGILIQEAERWSVSRPISRSDISSTIHGVIAARLDRLEKDAKRILQQASVIGRAFFYEILKRVTDVRNDIDRSLNGLERLDLIRTKSLKPDLEYIFKHALTQEVVYSGLLKKERQGIHERIGLVMETMFRDRLPEFYEALAFHFSQGRATDKAITYLTRSGEKSLRKYAVEEAHRFYKEAFDLLTDSTQARAVDTGRLIDLLIQWAFVYHYRGDFKGLNRLLVDHERVAADLGDPARLGMLYTFLGLSWYQMGRVKTAYHYQRKALKLGEESADLRVVAYTCSWLAWTCAELGELSDAVAYGERAMQMHRELASEDFLFFNSLGGIGLACYYGGDIAKALEIGRRLIEFGQSVPNIRSLVLGHFTTGCGRLMVGDMQAAAAAFRLAIEVSADPFYAQFPKLLLCLCHVLEGRFDEAEGVIEGILDYSGRFGTEIIGTPARSLAGFVAIAQGRSDPGLKMVESAQNEFLDNGRKFCLASSENITGKMFMQIAQGAGMNLTLVRNLKFLLQNVPFASRRAEAHLTRAIQVAREIEAHLLLGHCYLDLGRLYRFKGKIEKGRKCIQEAMEIFKSRGAEVHFQQARAELQSPLQPVV